jgi:hypothetical protein
MTEPFLAARPPRPVVFRAGAALNRSLSVLAQNFAAFVLIAAAVTFPNYVVEATRGDDLIWSVVAAILSGILFYLSQGVLAYAAFQDSQGAAGDVSQSVTVAMSRFFPLMNLAGWVGLAVGLGFILLIVPGIVFLVMFSVAVPACVVEGLGAVASMQRSAQLTKGYRWPLLGLYVLLFVLVWMTKLALHRVLAQIGGAPLETFGLWAARAVVTAFHAVLGVVIYHDLRLAKEGADFA